MAGYDGRGAKFDWIVAEGADASIAITAVDSLAAAVNLSAATIVAAVETLAGAAVVTMSSPVSGAGSNIITLSLTDAQTTSMGTGRYRWSLMVTRAGVTLPWLSGAFRVVDPSDGRITAVGTTVTATVDTDVTVTVSIGDASDALVASFIDDPTSDTTTALAAQYAPVMGLPASPLTAVTLTAIGSTPQVIDYFDGYLYGYTAVPGVIARSSDDGATWATAATVSSGSGVVTAIRPTGDGEVLVLRTDGFTASAIHKSSGWATSPATATWSQVLDTNGTGAAYALPWGFDGDGAKWIVTHYAASGSWIDSRYVWISVDSGDTWTQVYDTGADALSHNHAACYDPWADRFLFSIGHDVSAGVYYSDNDGATWARIVDSELIVPSPTVIVATDDGYVCGTDSVPGGIYGITRRTDPTDMRMEFLWRWSAGRAGLIGFAQRGFRDITGVVYIGYNSNYSTTSAVVAGGTASSAAEVWRDPTPSLNGRMFNNVITSTGRFVGDYLDSTGATVLFEAWTTRPNARYVDDGNALGGTAVDGSSLAVGTSTTASLANSTAVGVGVTSGANSTAVGTGALTGGTDSLAVGYLASSNAATATSVGASSIALGEGVAVGASAVNTSTAAVAVGRSASAGNAATAVGRGAVASASGADAFGYNALSASANSVALGSQSVVTAASQVKIGSRHIELVEITEPAAGATNSARLYVKDNGGGKSQLCVRFASGAVQVIATEP